MIDAAAGTGSVQLEQIEAGLFRWTLPHPEWRPGAEPGSLADWPREVGCVLFEADDATVLIDPLLPAEPQELLATLDRRVARRDRPVSILTTIGFHRRSRDDLARRYDASTSRAKKSLPAGVQSFSVRGAGETIFWIPEHRTLVPGDRIIGAASGGLRVCPQSWLRYLSTPIGSSELKQALRPLLELPVQHVLVSHGEPVLQEGQAALTAALD